MTIYLFIDLPFNEIGSKSTFPGEREKEEREGEERVKRGRRLRGAGFLFLD